MIARVLAAAHVAVHAGRNEPLRQRRTEQKMIDAEPGVAADLAFFSEILTADSCTRAVLAKSFQRFAQTFDQNLDHIMFRDNGFAISTRRTDFPTKLHNRRPARHQ
jgi:hypothetical protein